MNIIYAQEAIEDLCRLRDFVAQYDEKAAHDISTRLLESIDRIESHPYIGKPVQRAPNPELLRDFITRKYIIRYIIGKKNICILRVWHQKESKPS